MRRKTFDSTLSNKTVSGMPRNMQKVLHTGPDKALGREKLAETPQNA
ncbi:hypothetical protein E2C01_047726 [Portunus trituberculatus]|uniref:Uncharacterized protein n=1 Tax=Portunus trituberculatus TaxID=210409 RepID=A0A5B7G8N8_PORTR|nr:hypothetical protein [Portunus trituberculatus]